MVDEENLSKCKKYAEELHDKVLTREQNIHLLFNLLLELGGDQDFRTAKKYVERLI